MKKHIRLIGIIILLLVIIISGTYAFYTGRIDKTGESTASFKSKTLGVNFQDGPEIALSGILPGQKIIKKFSVTNTGDDVGIYHMEFINVLNELTRKSDLVYSLTATNSGAEFNEKEFASRDGTFAVNVEIAAGVTQEYTMVIEYKNLNENQSVDMNSHINATIQISDIIKSVLPYVLNDSEYTLSSSQLNEIRTAIDEYNVANNFDSINWDTANVVIFKVNSPSWWDYTSYIDCLGYQVFIYPSNYLTSTWSSNTDFSNIEFGVANKYINITGQDSYLYSLTSRTIGALYHGWYVDRSNYGYKQFFGDKTLMHVQNARFDFYYYENYPIWISNNFKTTDAINITGDFIAVGE